VPAGADVPDVFKGVEIVPLSYGREIELPGDIALIVDSLCCTYETSAARVPRRVYRDPSGHIRTDTLLDLKSLGFDPTQSYLASLAIRQDASEMVADICVACVPEVHPSVMPRAVLYRSTDGGVTWQEFGDIDRGLRVVGLLENGVILVSSGSQETDPKYTLFPGSTLVDPPTSSLPRMPVVLPNGKIVWWERKGLLRIDGYSLLPSWSQLPSVHMGVDILLDNDGRPSLATANVDSGFLSFQLYLLSIAPDGSLSRVFPLQTSVRPTGWIGPQLLVGNSGVIRYQLSPSLPQSSFVSMPALIDLERAEIRPIVDPFLEMRNVYSYTPLSNEPGPTVRAVQRGPFARVVNTGSCLNVRAGPSTSAEVLDCAADGVLLRDTGETQEAEGTTWLRAQTPAGIDGWAATAYLER